jgi:uncharacterized membrane protein
VPLIPADNVFAMGTVLFGLTYLGFWIDSHPIGKKTSGVVWVLLAGMALSNFGITPFSAPAYDFVGGYMVSLAIPLLLFKADLRKIIRESGKVMITFLVAGAAIVVGALVGYFLMDLGPVGPKVTGVYIGGYIGGAVNFLAVSQVVGMTEAEFATAISAGSIMSVLALMMLIAAPSMRWITKFVPLAATEAMTDHEQQALKEENRPRVRLTHLTGVLALSFGICTLSALIGGFIGQTTYNILFVTILTLVVANLFPKVMDSLEGEFDLGMIFMYLFFAMVGSSTNFHGFAGSTVTLFIFGMIMILIHFAIVLVFARVMKVDLAEAIVASGACVVGPAVTAAIAISQGWRSLVTPAIMTGIFGYVIGTFIGVGVSALLQ